MVPRISEKYCYNLLTKGQKIDYRTNEALGMPLPPEGVHGRLARDHLVAGVAPVSLESAKTIPTVRPLLEDQVYLKSFNFRFDQKTRENRFFCENTEVFFPLLLSQTWSSKGLEHLVQTKCSACQTWLQQRMLSWKKRKNGKSNFIFFVKLYVTVKTNSEHSAHLSANLHLKSVSQ